MTTRPSVAWVVLLLLGAVGVLGCLALWFAVPVGGPDVCGPITNAVHQGTACNNAVTSRKALVSVLATLSAGLLVIGYWAKPRPAAIRERLDGD